jgi:hypothetical protein
MDFAGLHGIRTLAEAAPPGSLTLAAHLFHFCSHGSRDARRGAEPRMEGAYALRQRLSGRDAIDAQVRLPQAP